MKYKLIKEYPGSPKLGTIVNGLISKSSDLNYSYSYNNFDYFISKEIIENNPEYWEKIQWVCHFFIPGTCEATKKYFDSEEEMKKFIYEIKPTYTQKQVDELNKFKLNFYESQTDDYRLYEAHKNEGEIYLLFESIKKGMIYKVCSSYYSCKTEVDFLNVKLDMYRDLIQRYL
jgi:hypothetical protein